jgi:hydroxymethylbilane synthase
VNSSQILIGSRGSQLALAQAKLVVDALERAGLKSRIVVVETEGDRRPPDTAWGEGAFVAAIERELLAGRVDVAIHSAKDIPTDEDQRLQIAAYLARDDPRDALVVRAGAEERRLDDLPPNARVGTDSPRRTGFMLARRPDLAVHPLHGNVDTRLSRLDAGATDALVLACAGLDRIARSDRIAERMEPDVMPPAPGQGAIAVQVRRDDARMLELVAAIDDRPTRLTVEAERAFLSASGGGCRAPIGALATITDDELELLGGWASPDGSDTAVARRRGPVTAGEELAREVAAALDFRTRVPKGATDLLPNPPRSTARRVLVARAAEQADELASALRHEGLDPVRVPTIAVEPDPPGGELDAAARRLDTYAWVVITSANGARAILESADRFVAPLETPRWAAIGPATRAVLEHAGITVAVQPSQANGNAMGVELPVVHGDRVLVIRGDLAGTEIAVALRARGAEVDDVVAYRTREAPASSGPLLRRALLEGRIDAVVFTSGSTVRGLVALASASSVDVSSIPSVCIGPKTAADARVAGFSVLAVAATPEATALAATTARALAAHHEDIG